MDRGRTLYSARDLAVDSCIYDLHRKWGRVRGSYYYNRTTHISIAGILYWNRSYLRFVIIFFKNYAIVRHDQHNKILRFDVNTQSTVHTPSASRLMTLKFSNPTDLLIELFYSLPRLICKARLAFLDKDRFLPVRTYSGPATHRENSQSSLYPYISTIKKQPTTSKKKISVYFM